MNKNRKQIEDKKPKKAPLVYINRVEMKELDENNEYEFLPDIIDKDGNVINRDDLSEDDKKKYDKAVTRKISHDKKKAYDTHSRIRTDPYHPFPVKRR